MLFGRSPYNYWRCLPSRKYQTKANLADLKSHYVNGDNQLSKTLVIGNKFYHFVNLPSPTLDFGTNVNDIVGIFFRSTPKGSIPLYSHFGVRQGPTFTI